MAWRIDELDDDHYYQHHQLLLTNSKNYQNPNYHSADPVNHSFPLQQQQQQQRRQLLLPSMNPNQLPAATGRGLDSLNLQRIMNNNNNSHVASSFPLSTVLQNQGHYHHDLEAAFARMNMPTEAVQPAWPSPLPFPVTAASPDDVGGYLSNTIFQVPNSMRRRNGIDDLFPPLNSSPAADRFPTSYTGSWNNRSLYRVSSDENYGHRNGFWYDRIGDRNSLWWSRSMLKNNEPPSSNHRPSSSLQRFGNIGSGYRNGSSTSYSLRHAAALSCYSLEEVRLRLVELAKAKESSKALQAMWESYRPHSEQGELIFAGVKGNLNELMEDQYGNHLVQKVFELCSHDQMAQILLVFSGNKDRFVDTCLSQHGTRAVQKMIEHIQAADQRAALLSTMNEAIIRLCKDQHGQHVVQQCLKCFVGDRSIMYALEQIAEHCLDLSMDKSGCCVVQGAASYAKIYGEAHQVLDHLCASIVSNAVILSEHPFGNYVVQYVIEMRMESVNSRIVNKLIGSHISLSMSKYGSNVVEKCLRFCGDKEKAVIINEIMSSPHFLDFLQDPYGNYVAQTALKRSEGVLQNKLVNMIQGQYPHLHSHLHGKKVLARTRSGNKHLHRGGLSAINEFPSPRRHF